MAVTITPHGWRPREDSSDKVDAPAGQSGDAVTVADGAVSAAFASAGLYRIKASTACTVRIGEDLTDASDGEAWSADEKEYRFIAAGQKLAVDAAS